MIDEVYNPWFDISEDFIWIRDHVWLIIRFIVENTILAFSFSKKDAVDGINGDLTELYFYNPRNWREISFQVVNGLIGAPVLSFALTMVSVGSSPVINNLDPSTVTLFTVIAIIPLGLISPFMVIIAYVEISLIMLYFLLRIIQSYKLQSTHSPPVPRAPVTTFFLNGICVNEYWEGENCLRIKKVLGDKVGTVVPISNPSYGIVADLFEAIVLRNFRVNSVAVCEAADVLDKTLRNSNKGDIIRLISHSQGTILANLVVQRLYYTLSLKGRQDLLKRLHVHTFAYADRNFVNPENLLGVVEHYVNKEDPIVLFGIDRNSKAKQFDGNVFVNNSGKGHLFNRFYSLEKDSYVPRGHNKTSDLLS